MAIFSMSKLKGDNGVVRTRSLFYELSYENSADVVFTLKEHDCETADGRPLISLQQLFLHYTVEDPTEYQFAYAVFGSWDIWQKIADMRAIQKYLAEWRKEADVRRKCEAFKTITSELKEGKNAYQAAKYLIEEPWKSKSVESQQDKRKARADARETAEKAFEVSGIADDIKRLKEEGLIN